jgi:hypothetical protein
MLNPIMNEIDLGLDFNLNIFLFWFVFLAEELLIMSYIESVHRLCGLVVRVSGYRSRGRGFDSQRYQIFWEVVGLERGPLSLMRIIEELLERKVTAPV